MLKIGTVKDNDWGSVRQAIQKLSKIIGTTAASIFTSLTLTSLTANTIIKTDSTKKLVSLADGEDGQLVFTDGDSNISWQWPFCGVDTGHASTSYTGVGISGGAASTTSFDATLDGGIGATY